MHEDDSIEPKRDTSYEDELWSKIRERYDSVMVNVLMKLGLTVEQRIMILDELALFE